jgi:hypothetical protein
MTAAYTLPSGEILVSCKYDRAANIYDLSFVQISKINFICNYTG